MFTCWRALRTPILLMAVGLVASGVPVRHVAMASAGPVPPGGHSEVIAQSLVGFGDGEFSWQLATLPISETEPTAITADPATFVVADGPAAAVATPSGGGSGGARLAVGEAVVALPGVGFDVVAASPEGERSSAWRSNRGLATDRSHREPEYVTSIWCATCWAPTRR